MCKSKDPVVPEELSEFIVGKFLKIQFPAINIECKS